MMAILVQSNDPERKEAPPHPREDLRQQHQRATAADEFRETLGTLGLAQCHVARLFAVGPRSVRRWQHGQRRVPLGIVIVCRLLAAGAIPVDQVEAVVPVSARANGGAKPESLAPLPVASAPEQSALARAETVVPATSGSTVAEQVLALAPGTCRWPC